MTIDFRMACTRCDERVEGVAGDYKAARSGWYGVVTLRRIREADANRLSPSCAPYDDATQDGVCPACITDDDTRNPFTMKNNSAPPVAFDPMTVEDAFKAGIERVRAGDIVIVASSVPVLAAYNVFCKKCKGVEHDERFAAQAPLFAAQLIVKALLADTKQAKGGVP